MKYCKNCKVSIQGNLTKCLFCNNDLMVKSEINEDHFPYVQYKHSGLSNWTKAFTLGLLFIIFVVGLIDFSLNRTLTWSIIVITSCVCCYFLNFIVFYFRGWLKKVVLTASLLLLLTILISIIIPNQFYLLDFLVPCGIFTLTFFVDIVVISRRIKWYDYGIYLFFVSLLGVLPLIFYLLGMTSISWPSIVCFSFSLISFIGMWLYADRSSKDELKRRFHL